MRQQRIKLKGTFLSRFAAVLMSACMLLSMLQLAPAIPAYASSDVSSQTEETSSDETSSKETADEDTSSEPEHADPSENEDGITAAVIADAKPDFEIHSKAVYLVNTDTDADIKVFAQSENDRRSPASLTKIMTAIIVLENVSNLNAVVTAPSYIYDEFYGIGVSNADIQRGEEITVKDLLYALMLRSACEAASILADYVCQNDIPTFVSMMNAKAAQLGCTNTQFMNAHGLDAEGQYTTAYDMYLIARYAMQNETFAEIACSPTYTMQATNKHSEERNIWHTNYMLSTYYGGSNFYEYARGIKTGTTDDAGRNLVTVGEKEGYHYLLVTLGAPYRDAEGAIYSENFSYTDHRNLYDWAFDTFRFTSVIEEYQSLDEVAVRFGDNSDHVTVTSQKKVIMLLPKTLDISTILLRTNLPEEVDAPVVKGDVVGKADLVLADDVIASVDLIAEADVARSGLSYSLFLVQSFFKNPWVIACCVVLVLLCGTLVFFVVTERRKRKNDKLRKKYGKGKPKQPTKQSNPNSWR